MLNIVTLNCDDALCEYQWESQEEFLSDMESDKEEIPMLDDIIITMDTGNRSRNEEDLREEGVYTVADLVEWCKSI